MLRAQFAQLIPRTSRYKISAGIPPIMMPVL
jgi:hypothetical protein